MYKKLWVQLSSACQQWNNATVVTTILACCFFKPLFRVANLAWISASPSPITQLHTFTSLLQQCHCTCLTAKKTWLRQADQPASHQHHIWNKAAPGSTVHQTDTADCHTVLSAVTAVQPTQSLNDFLKKYRSRIYKDYYSKQNVTSKGFQLFSIRLTNN